MSNVWGWFEQASNQAKELVTNAQILATELSKQAIEIKENYNAEIQRSILSNIEKSSNVNHIVLLPRENTQLEEINLVYITENLIGMGFPYDPRKDMNTKGNRIDDVAGYLKSHHDSRYMIWNISEESYDYSLFADQVLEYKFPGHPAPPLGLMFKICSSIESWLDADERNVAIVHCLTGKGRTAVVLACALTWIGEFNSPMEALTYIAERKNSSIDILTIPSQRRYIQYFSNVLDGVRPRGEPLLLRRIIMNGIPKYGSKADNNSNEVVGCCPYIQLFKNGKIIANGLIASGPSQDAGGEDNPVRWVTCSEESISFQIDCVVQGDLLLRCRHHDPTSGARISMFRAAFHTGYVPSGVLRLTKAQLDGPNHDDRYSNDFYIDLIFAPVEKADQVSNHTGSLSDAGTNLDHTVADKFEQMFHRDTRFWETISARKLKTKRRKSRKFQSELSEKFSILDDGKHKKHSDFELDDGDEIHFSESAPSTVLSSDIFLSGPSTLGTSELSDDELIKQLAEAAENVDLDYSSEKSNTNTNETTLQTTIKENQQSEVLQFDIKQSVVDSSQTLLNLPTTSARAELQALEDLEKELGLDLGSSAVSTIPSNISSSNKQDDNLDDLEDFLESLNK